MNEEVRPPLAVLIVEDLEDAALSMAELLILCGYSVRVALCGADALREAAAEMPDVVLLDIGLPDMNGWEVAEQLRRNSSDKQPFIAVLSGYGTDDDRTRSADAGCDIHLLKPADPLALTALLARIGETFSERQLTTVDSTGNHR